MSFDTTTRNKLRRMVGACKRLLADEFDEQLQGLSGIYAQDGCVLELEKLTSLDDDHNQIATLLRDRNQYFNDGAERKKMREESSAPRNSRELAVRNQFFTPRYFVEVLIDNTLGRIGYEMTGGRTALKKKCRYLLRRPTEVFLAGSAEVYRQLFSKDADAEEMKPHGWVPSYTSKCRCA